MKSALISVLIPVAGTVDGSIFSQDATTGTAFAGVATRDNSVAPEQALIAVTYQSVNTILGVVEILDRI